MEVVHHSSALNCAKKKLDLRFLTMGGFHLDTSTVTRKRMLEHR